MSGNRMIWFLILFCLAAIGAKACDGNLLSLLETESLAPGFFKGVLGVSRKVCDLAESLSSLERAKSAFDALEREWESLPPEPKGGVDSKTFPGTPSLGPSALNQRGNLLSDLEVSFRKLRDLIRKENLISAHEEVQRFFFLTMRVLALGPFQSWRGSLLSITEKVWLLQESTRSGGKADLQALTGGLRTAIREFRTQCPEEGLPALEKVSFWAARLEEVAALDQDPTGEGFLVGVSRLKKEFGQFNLSMRSVLASSPRTF